MIIEKKELYGDKFDTVISEKKSEEIKEKKKLDKARSQKVVALLVPWKKGEDFSTYRQHLELYDEVNSNVSDPRTRFLAIIGMLKTEGHYEEAMNIQESLRHKVNETNIVKKVIKILASMNERSRAEKAKESLGKLLDTRKTPEDNVTDTVTKFRNHVSEWEAISKVPLDGFLKANLLFRTLNISEQVEGNIRTKVDFNMENGEDLYVEVEKAIRDLANSIHTVNTYHFNDQRTGKKFFSRQRSQSRENEGSRQGRSGRLETKSLQYRKESNS